MEKIKKVCHKISKILEWAIGYALMVCLFVGGLGFIGFIVALCIGGETATNICTWLYKTFYVILIKVATITTIVCFIMIYLKGDANWVNPIKYWKNKAKERKEKKISQPESTQETIENNDQPSK